MLVSCIFIFSFYWYRGVMYFSNFSFGHSNWLSNSFSNSLEVVVIIRTIMEQQMNFSWYIVCGTSKFPYIKTVISDPTIILSSLNISLKYSLHKRQSFCVLYSFPYFFVWGNIYFLSKLIISVAYYFRFAQNVFTYFWLCRNHVYFCCCQMNRVWIMNSYTRMPVYFLCKWFC